jgi:hypothetical protein
MSDPGKKLRARIEATRDPIGLKMSVSDGGSVYFLSFVARSACWWYC